MKKHGVLSLFILLLLCSCCSANGKQQETAAGSSFQVELGYERHEDVPGTYKIDFLFPRVSDSVANASAINDRLKEDYMIEGDIPAVAEGYPYTWLEIHYLVSRQNGVCCLSILDTISSAYGSYSPNISVNNYFYNENTQQVMNREEFFKALGLSREDVTKAYAAACCPAYGPDDISFDGLTFYYTEQNELRFVFSQTALARP